MITLDHLTKTYPGGVTAVDDLSLRVAPGELLVLVGPSGCGKTTTLRLIAGLEEPTSGSVHLGGRPMAGVPPWQRDVALAFQRPALYPHRTVRDNLAFGLDLRRGGWLRQLAWLLGGPPPPLLWVEREARVVEVARLLEIENVLRRRPGDLSGGQQQRVALGRCLVRRPLVLLLDEPLSGLDSRQRNDLRRQIRQLRPRLPTAIHVTHDPVEALALGDRVAVLLAGRLEQVGSPLEVYRRPAGRFVAGFLGWPPMSFLDGRLLSEDNRLYLIGEGCTLPLTAGWAGRLEQSGGQVALGVRPDCVQLQVDGAGEPAGGPPSPALEMEVALVEFQGPATLVTCRRGGWRLTGTIPEPTGAGAGGRPRLGEGQRVMAHVRLEQAYLFDGLTGKTLLAGFEAG